MLRKANALPFPRQEYCDKETVIPMAKNIATTYNANKLWVHQRVEDEGLDHLVNQLTKPKKHLQKMNPHQD